MRHRLTERLHGLIGRLERAAGNGDAPAPPPAAKSANGAGGGMASLLPQFESLVVRLESVAGCPPPADASDEPTTPMPRLSHATSVYQTHGEL